MKSERSRYSGYRFPPEIISYAVWAYHRFCLSFRDVEDLLAERGIIVSYETIRQWCEKFGPVSGFVWERGRLLSVAPAQRASEKENSNVYVESAHHHRLHWQ